MSTTKGQAEKDKGNHAFKQGDFPTAIGHYSAAILVDPTNPTYPLNRAAAYLKLGKSEDAERDCDRVLALDPKNVKAVFRRGQARVGRQKLAEARADFQRALQIDPANSAAKAELLAVEQALKAQSAPEQKRQSVEVPVPPLPSISAPPASTPRLKRRRVPIEIVDGPAPLTSNTKPSVPAATQEAGRSDLMTPVSSRPLTSTPGTKPAPDTPAQAKTFHAAKEARPAARTSAVRGGIFRPNGKHTLFGENRGEELVASSPPAASLVPANTPPPITQKPPAAQTAQAAASSQVLAEQSITHGTRRRAPLTLFDFSREWERCLTSEDRWALLKGVSPETLPSLFQSSLEAQVLAGIAGTLRDVLRAGDLGTEERERVRDYMVGLTQVKRFSTVVLFMSDEERGAVKDACMMLGGGEGARAWGVS